jgi:hypothetical protein
MTEKREWRRSEARRLKPRTCGTCGGTENSRIGLTPDMGPGKLDPVVVVSWQCTDWRCTNHGPF